MGLIGGEQIMFKGAVLVSREKIKKFLEVWDENYSHYESKLKEARSWAIKYKDDYYDNLSSFKKLWHGKIRDGYALRWSAGKKLDCRYCEFDMVYDILQDLGYLPSARRWGIMCWGVTEYNQIKNLYKCGEPVYLNADQARVVNSILEMKSLQDLLKEEK